VRGRQETTVPLGLSTGEFKRGFALLVSFFLLSFEGEGDRGGEVD